MVKAADLGQRLRVRIGVDSNESNKKPDAIEVFSPLSDVVTPPPPPPADPGQPTTQRRQRRKRRHGDTARRRTAPRPEQRLDASGQRLHAAAAPG